MTALLSSRLCLSQVAIPEPRLPKMNARLSKRNSCLEHILPRFAERSFPEDVASRQPLGKYRRERKNISVYDVMRLRDNGIPQLH